MAAVLLLIVSLLVVVAACGADASPSMRPDKVSSAVLGGSHDPYRKGLADDAAAAAVVDPEECDDDEDYDSSHKHHDKHHHKNHGDGNEDEYPDHKHDKDDNECPDDPEHQQESPYAEADSMEQELCSDCEEPKTTPPPPPCNTCEEPKEPELKCNKVHAVRDGETCYSMWQCAGLGQDDFLRFNPNICCDNLFVGQWVCLDAKCDA